MIDFLTKNWVYIALILSILGGIIQTIFNYFLKRKEIIHSMIQVNRMEAIKDYMSAYYLLYINLKDFSSFAVTGNQLEEEIQQHYDNVRECFIKLNSSNLIMELFMNAEELAKLQAINAKFEEVSLSINKWFIDRPESGESIIAIYTQVIPNEIPKLMSDFQNKLKRKH